MQQVNNQWLLDIIALFGYNEYRQIYCLRWMIAHLL